jgi:hypothetical protein
VIYPQRDYTRTLVGYGFDRNKVMTLCQPQEPARDDAHEVQLPAVIDVEVLNFADEPAMRVKHISMAEVAIRGAGMLVTLQSNKVHGTLLSSIYPYYGYYQYREVLRLPRYILAPSGYVLGGGDTARRGSGRKERIMYAAIRRYHTDPDSIDEIARRVNEEFLDIISDMPGFVAYFVLNAGQGEIGSVSVFEDQQRAEESNSRAEEWVRQNLSDLLPTPPDFAAGEVVAYKAR